MELNITMLLMKLYLLHLKETLLVMVTQEVQDKMVTKDACMKQ